MKKGFRLLESKKQIGEARSLFHTISPFINCTQEGKRYNKLHFLFQKYIV